jgi:Cu-Zn family superoxide dismutase
MHRFLLLPLLLVSLAACETTEEAVDDTGEVAEDAADATAQVARGAADTAEDAAQDAARGAEDVGQAAVGVGGDALDAVTDAAGDTWNAATDVFDDDPEADAVALVRPTTADGASAEGTVRFMETGGDLVVMVSLRGLAPGAHGFHIHQNPACGPADTDGDGQMEPAGAAGAHWDPHNTNDHGAPTEEITQKHLGDLGNIEVGSDGMVETTLTVSNYNPSEHNVAGHALVVHMGRDDLETDPSGGAGTPQGCGVIEARM